MQNNNWNAKKPKFFGNNENDFQKIPDLVDPINLKIREASNKDIESIKFVVFTALEEYGLKPDEDGIDSDLNDIWNNYLQKNGYFGVIINNSEKNNVNGKPEAKIVGTFGLYKIDDNNCEIRKMYFLPEARGKGLGKKVIRFLITMAIEKGYQNILLETNSVLKEAIALYEKSGFKKIDSEHLSKRCDQTFILELHS